jgi:hypothetical protein
MMFPPESTGLMASVLPFAPVKVGANPAPSALSVALLQRTFVPAPVMLTVALLT